MSFTEHSIALVAIIVGLGLANLLSDLHRLISARARVRWAAVPMLWAAFAFLLVINYWWALYFRGLGVTTASSAGGFLVSIVQPMILYLACANVLPGAVPESGLNLRERYFAECRFFLSLVLLYVAITHIQVGITTRWEWTSGSAIRLVVFALILPLLWIRSYWHHLVASAITLMLLFLGLFLQAKL